ncbi:MAG: cysteine synthase family protein [Cytophagales bacterium]|nr:cysteine synthase family protein [Cytophagales bacterium]
MTELNENDLEKRVADLGKFIGHTPLYPITGVFNKPNVEIFAKLEWQQLSGSVKARPAYNIFKTAIQNDELREGMKLVDASSGNTAIAYATIGAKLGIGVTICMPETASIERVEILRNLGVDLVLTDAEGGSDLAQATAQKFKEEQPQQYFYADQYSNNANWKAHYKGTSLEIWNQTNREITHFITGMGTTGTFTGVSTRFEEMCPHVHRIALQPEGPDHVLEGWKHLATAKVPGIYNPDLPHEIRVMQTLEARKLIPEVAQQEGLLISPSAASNLMGAIQLAEELDEGLIVTMFPDNADKYGVVTKEIFASYDAS